MKFKTGGIYVVREECYKNKERWVKSMKDKDKGNHIHVKWCISRKEELINQWCIERKATKKDIDDLKVEVL